MMSGCFPMKYIHTLGGQPAFYDGEQICFAGTTKSSAVVIVESIDQIRREQALSKKWRKSKGFMPTSFEAGWVYVRA